MAHPLHRVRARPALDAVRVRARPAPRPRPPTLRTALGPPADRPARGHAVDPWWRAVAPRLRQVTGRRARVLGARPARSSARGGRPCGCRPAAALACGPACGESSPQALFGIRLSLAADLVEVEPSLSRATGSPIFASDLAAASRIRVNRSPQ